MWCVAKTAQRTAGTATALSHSKITLLLHTEIICDFGSCGTLSTLDNMFNWFKHTPPIVFPTDSYITKYIEKGLNLVEKIKRYASKRVFSLRQWSGGNSVDENTKSCRSFSTALRARLWSSMSSRMLSKTFSSL